MYLVYNPVCVPVVSLPIPVLLSISLPLLVWPFTLIEKSDCDKMQLVISEINYNPSQTIVVVFRAVIIGSGT